MRNQWDLLRHTFERITLRTDLHHAFLAAATTHAALARFDSIAELQHHVVGRSDDLTERDAVVRALVVLVHDADTRKLATALLWLGLWPGLDAIYRRRLRCVGGATHELTSAIAAAFTSLVHGLDLARVHRVAATLVRSTEREVLAQLARTWREERRFISADADEDLDVAEAPLLLDLEGEVRAVRAWLVPEVGADADLLVAVTVFGDSQSEAAERIGISPAAARKRFQRAMARVRLGFARSAFA